MALVLSFHCDYMSLACLCLSFQAYLLCVLGKMQRVCNLECSLMCRQRARNAFLYWHELGLVHGKLHFDLHVTGLHANLRANSFRHVSGLGRQCGSQ